MNDEPTLSKNKKLIINLTLDKEKQLYEILRPVAAFTIKSEQQAVKEALLKICDILNIELERV